MNEIFTLKFFILGVIGCLVILGLLIVFRKQLQPNLFRTLLAIFLLLLTALGLLGHWKYQYPSVYSPETKPEAPTQTLPKERKKEPSSPQLPSKPSRLPSSPTPSPSPQEDTPHKLRGKSESQKQRIQDFLDKDLPQ